MNKYTALLKTLISDSQNQILLIFAEELELCVYTDGQTYDFSVMHYFV
jgi:hypothetical protein